MISAPLAVFSNPLNSEKKAIIFDSVDQVFPVVGPFNESMQEDFARKVMTHELPYMYLYFDSPGGSIASLTRMIEIMRTRDIVYIGIARHAFSAAFMLFQHCDVRIMFPNGMLMSHNASTVSMGTLEQISNIIKEYKKIVNRLSMRIAKRMKISLSKYKALIANNLWMNAATAKKMNATDIVFSNVSCTKEMVERTYEKKTKSCRIFGCVTKKYKFSECPLITEPVEEIKE